MDLIGEKAGGGRPAHAGQHAHVEQIGGAPFDLIHSTMSPDLRSTICTPHQGSASRALLLIERKPDKGAIAWERYADNGVAVVEGEAAKEARASTMPPPSKSGTLRRSC